MQLKQDAVGHYGCKMYLLEELFTFNENNKL
jgi:hypothetical protein